MKRVPFPGSWDYWGSAYGLDYAIRIVKDRFELTWLAECFIRFPVGHIYYQDNEFIQANLNMPVGSVVHYDEYETGHGARWIGVAFEPLSLESAQAEVEEIIRQTVDVMAVETGGATLGPPFLAL